MAIRIFFFSLQTDYFYSPYHRIASEIFGQALIGFVSMKEECVTSQADKTVLREEK